MAVKAAKKKGKKMLKQAVNSATKKAMHVAVTKAKKMLKKTSKPKDPQLQKLEAVAAKKKRISEKLTNKLAVTKRVPKKGKEGQ